MTRLWAAGVPVAMIDDPADRSPRQFRWAGRVHPVARVVKRWRVDEDWWQARVRREYFKVLTTTGLLVILFLDRQSGQWYLQRLYD